MDTKRAVILHGTDGDPDDIWFPWLRGELESVDYEVYAPLLPNNHRPDFQIYEDFLQRSGWDFSDNLLVGYSSGATTILNLLTTDWFPPVKTVVLVGTFLNEKLTKHADWVEEGQFDKLFVRSFVPILLKNRAQHFYFVHGDNDPYCDIDDAKRLCYDLNGQFITVHNGHHLGDSSGMLNLPQLTDKLRADKVL